MIHGGVVDEYLINYFDKFGPELLVIQFGFLVILSTLFLWLWFSNRRKYHNLKHAIPATVVKSYLDSIIQNSTALKSSLFRGGGLETNGVPSVMPLHNLMGGDSLALSGAPSTALMEELNQKKAQIASLEAQISSSQNAQKEIDTKFNSTQKNLFSAQNRIKELEQMVNQAGGGSDYTMKSELEAVAKERDELAERLREFEIISADLANLKRLKQENEQLKRSLAAKDGDSFESFEESESESIETAAEINLPDESPKATEEVSLDAAEFENMASATDETPAVEASSQPASEPQVAAAAPAPAKSEAPTEENKPKQDKTSEDLLSEFEKMLG
jgi:hypothetical protein